MSLHGRQIALWNVFPYPLYTFMNGSCTDQVILFRLCIGRGRSGIEKSLSEGCDGLADLDRGSPHCLSKGFAVGIK